MSEDRVLYSTSPLGQGDIVITDDNYAGLQASVHHTAGIKVERILEGYVSALRELVDSGGLEGQTATKLYEFAGTAEGLLKGAAQEIGTKKKKYMQEFLEQVDVADEEIY